MKLQFYFTALLLVSTGFAKAQKADTVQAIVHYKFTHVRDTLNRDKPLTENMMLLVGRSASWYRSYDRKVRDEQMRKNMMAQLNSGSGSINMPPQAGGPLGPNIEYYQFPNENKFYSKERLFNNYLMEENMPAIAWKITTDTLTIKGLACQKATARFKGRDYTVWFCADLPYRVGPWKLNGLPGLLVEAYDAKKEVMFLFDGLEKIDPNEVNKPADNGSMSVGGRTMVMIGSSGGDNNQNPNVIELPRNGVKVTEKELAELKGIMAKDPQAFMQSQMAAIRSQAPAGATINVSANSGGNTFASGPGGINVQRSTSPTVVINNPIELREKDTKK